MDYTDAWATGGDYTPPSPRLLRDLRRRLRHLFEREGHGLKIPQRHCAACGQTMEVGERLFLGLCDSCFRHDAAFPEPKASSAPRRVQRRRKVRQLVPAVVVIRLARIWDGAGERASQTDDALWS